MNIYLIKRPYHTSYDVYFGHVIVANSPEEAMVMVKQLSESAEGPEIWAEEGSIENIGVYTGDKPEPTILMSDFNAG